MKLLIIGIDGATFDLIKPWSEAGHLPNLTRLMDNGVHANLASTLPPVTSPAWPTFMTGCNPGKHGVFDFIQPSGANYSMVNSTLVRQPTIWQRLSKAGYRVGVLNVPITYPAQPINGFMVTGIPSPLSGDICYPADLISRYQKEFGEYRTAPLIQYKPGVEVEYIKDIYDLIRAHGDWALGLMSREPWDVLMVHFIALDIMKHALWRFMDKSHPRYESSPYEQAIRDGYKLVDEYIGRMLARLPEKSTVLVMSDHGFGPLKQIVNLNMFLLAQGFLQLKNDWWTQLKAAAFKNGLTPAGVYHMIETIGLQNLATRVSKNARNKVVSKFLSFDNVDWRRTVAYSMGHVGQIYLNVVGREPQGVIKPENYHAVRQQIIDALYELKDENGKPVVTKIILREETYHGPYTEKGPDIHLVLDDYNMIAFPLFATNGKIFTQQIRGDSGCHRREGIFIGQGNGIKKKGKLPEANILDLAPTIMAVMNQPVPRVMDGRVLTEMFNFPPEVTYSEEASNGLGERVELSPEEAAQVEERLKSLGYL